ncbi:hypothetical protein RGQ13_19675 [Thalassotalea psychrophila]|uniref:DUF2946 domain-containing protein n=1 Tax=Thalassotalea psychrophila TaxID=3065647 RepID=A0ABY9TVG2_9GAMM|nr:hypothetical protein RGQ13_19675 [Colwelliaceae bacterium SQ149]
MNTMRKFILLIIMMTFSFANVAKANVHVCAMEQPQMMSMAGHEGHVMNIEKSVMSDHDCCEQQAQASIVNVDHSNCSDCDLYMGSVSALPINTMHVNAAGFNDRILSHLPPKITAPTQEWLIPPIA